MKEVIKHTGKNLVLSIIITAVVLAIFALFLAMPDILDWVSIYIGETTTWVIFIGAIAAFISWCVAE